MCAELNNRMMRKTKIIVEFNKSFKKLPKK